MTDATPRLRVTLVTPEWPGEHHSGGVARYAQRLAQELASLVELTVVTAEANHAELAGATVVHVAQRTGRFDRYYRLPFRLRKAVADSDPHVVHSFGDDWALPRAWPMVRTFHGSALQEARASSGLRRLNHYLLALLEQLSSRKANYRVAVGTDSLEEFRCDTVMPPVVRLTRLSERSTEPTVIFLGSFDGRKRGKLVASAVERIRSQELPKLRLVVVGPEADRRHWPSFTQHHSGLDDTAVQQLIGEAWVLAAPSTYEGFGIPVFEALSLGTPAVTSRTPGSEFIEKHLLGRRGLTFATEDELAENLLAYLTASTLRHEDIPEAQVEGLLKLGSTSRLVDEIYPAAAARFKKTSGLDRP